MSQEQNPVLGMALSGIASLDASAGTGKTYSIALIHLRLVLAQTPVERILVTTFTDDAAAELRERLRLRLVEARNVLAGAATDDANLRAVLAEASKNTGGGSLRDRIELALSAFDLAPICTIHGFCKRLLQHHALELGADPSAEILAEDPRLARLAGDAMARITATMEPGPDVPAMNHLAAIARTIREYQFPAPASRDLDNLIQSANQQWQKIARARLTEARRLWLKQKTDIHAALKELVLEGVILPGEYDNPSGKDSQRWKKLDATIEAVDTLLADVSPRDLVFSAGAKRMLASEIKHSADTEAHQKAVHEILSFLDRFSFFEQWALVTELPRLKIRLDQEARQRFSSDDILQRASQLRPDEHLIFSDLINAVFANLGDEAFVKAVRQDFDAVLVDECQDTDPRQIIIFNRLFGDTEWLGTGDKCLVWVGDPKQSIYRFRGADIDTYLYAKSGAGKDGRLTLNVNYRSDPPLVASINALFSVQKAGAVFDEQIAFEPVQSHKDIRIRTGTAKPPPAFCLHTWDADNHEKTPAKSKWLGPVLRDCAQQIAALLASNLQIHRNGCWEPVQPSHLAVLAYRKRDLETVRRHLLRLGIPSAYQTDSSVFLEDSARDMSLLLEALALPRPNILRAALTTPLLGYTLQEVAQMVSAGDLANHTSQFSALAERLEKEGILSVLFSILRDRPAQPGREIALVRLARQPDGERILTNLLQMSELLEEAWLNQHARSAGALKDYLDQAIARAGGNADSGPSDGAKLRLETDRPAVLLSTLHACKGLQYPIVFLPTIWAQRTHQQNPPCVIQHSTTAESTLILPGDKGWSEAVKQENKKLQGEQMRLLYVALTRAEHQVHAWWGRSASSEAYEASTAAAFGSLLLATPKDAEAYSDQECRAAFTAAMGRQKGATAELVVMPGMPSWCQLKESTSSTPSGTKTSAPTLNPAQWTRGVLSAGPLQSSYSALLRQDPENHSGADEIAPPAESSEEGGMEEPANAIEPVADVLAPFQAGKVLGDRIHCAFEAGMAASDPRQAQQHFSDALLRDLPALLQPGGESEGTLHEPPKLESVVDELWQRTTGALLGDTGCSISELLKQAHAPEWEYLLPQRASLNPRALAAILQKFGGASPWGRTLYAAKVEQLGFSPLEGYFKGIVDLLGQIPNGQWVLADYKTNRLEGYSPQHLDHAMADCHYLLQSVLYAVAVKRWLERSIEGWNYETGFAGTAYLFLRGMKAGSQQGVWFNKPPRPLVQELEKLICGVEVAP